MKSWPEDDRPREKLLRRGEHMLSDAELLAILLRTGSRGRTAVDVAREILGRFGTFRNMSQTDGRQWRKIKGLGNAKLAQIKAALEIGRRFREMEIRRDGAKISGAEDVVRIFAPRLRDLKKEVFQAIFLDARNRVIEWVEISEGTVSQVIPIIREILHRALQYFAVSLICLHNHPSGNVQPSREDEAFTRSLSQAAGLLQLRLLDHVIIGGDRFYSFAQQGTIV
ncbi:MAG: DNA repair protein RadC [Candidatus Omnitrophica bacterium]|nr:DNA repair protein RadC [Candidatus Omnitrophota bacterium]